MNSPLLVSILIPVYKVEKVFGKCLGTVFCQTYPHLEYVFVDDCSPDHSMDILHEAIGKYRVPAERIKIVRHETNQGIAITRNDCLAHASGDYVQFVDSDDWIEPDMVERMVRATNGGATDLVACDYFGERRNGRTVECHETYGNSCRENLMLALNYNIYTILWKLLIRRSLFRNIVFTPHLNIGEDYVATVKLYYYAQSFAHINTPLYHYSQLNDYRYSNIKLQNIEDHIKAVREVEAFLKQEGLLSAETSRQLNLRKFGVKSYFLSKPFLDYQRWRATFPESNHMWRYIPYSKKEKIKYWMAEHRLFPLLSAMQ